MFVVGMKANPYTYLIQKIGNTCMLIVFFNFKFEKGLLVKATNCFTCTFMSWMAEWSKSLDFSSGVSVVS